MIVAYLNSSSRDDAGCLSGAMLNAWWPRPFHALSSNSRTLTWRLVRLLALALSVYGLFACISFVRNQIAFEHFLNSLYITFDDFPPDYSEALKQSYVVQKPVEYDYSTLPSLDPATKIPPIIHFIWFKDLYETHPERTKIPSIGSQAPDLCRQYNPDFTIHIWNATAARDFMVARYPSFLPTYDGYRHPIQRVDAFKYFVLRYYGGVYMDLDIACRRPLAPLLEFPAWFPRASPLGVNNDLMATRAEHPIIKKMSETLKSRDKNLFFPYLTIFWTTGPQFTSDVFKMWFNERGGTDYVQGTSKSDAGES